MQRAFASSALFLTLALLWGCGETGRLLITLNVPAVAELDPLKDGRAFTLSLRVIEGTTFTEKGTSYSRNAQVQVGDVPADRLFTMRLAVKSGTDQILGLGQLENLKISAEDDTPKGMMLRKPMAFVGGAPNAPLVVDLVDPTAGRALPLNLAGGECTGLAASPKGDWLFAIKGSTLFSMDTDGTGLWGQSMGVVSFGAEDSKVATSIAVSPDNRYVVTCHAQAVVSVVDPLALGARQFLPTPINLQRPPGRVVFGNSPDLAWVLEDAVEPGECGGQLQNSTLAKLDLSTRSKIAEYPLDAPVADLALDPRDDSLVLALPCSKQLARWAEGDKGVTPLWNGNRVAEIFDLARTDQYFVTVGSRGTAAELMRIDLNTNGYSIEHSPLQTPPGVSFAQAGGTVLPMNPKNIVIRDFEASLDARQAIVLFQADYQAASGQCIYTSRLQGYMLSDLSSGGLLASGFANAEAVSCSGTCSNPCPNGTLRVEKLASPTFTPTGVTMLFGAP